MAWRLGLDLGTNSLGWAVIKLERGEAAGILAAGSRIFGAGAGFGENAGAAGRDPKTKESLAVDRRGARSMRRRRDRFLRRRKGLLKHLVAVGLLPTQEAERKALADLDPYELRARSLHEPLPLHHLGRALLHLNQRRGFKSNRKTERGKNTPEDGKIRVGIGRLYAAMQDAGAATLGEFLHQRRARASDPNAVPSVRARLRTAVADGKETTLYDFYPDRAMLQDEFIAITSAQARHHPGVLTADVRNRLFEVIFHQRPLKKPTIGKCTLVPEEPRLPKAHPLFQRRRLLEEINALEIERTGGTSHKLTRGQRNLLLLRLKDKRKVAYESLRKSLKLDPEDRFNKEKDDRKEMKGDEVASDLGGKKCFGTRWAHLDTDAQWTVISRILDQESAEDEANLVRWLQEVHGLSDAQARASAGAHLPEGYGRFGLTATTKLIAALEEEVIVYSDAVVKAGFGHHSDLRQGHAFDKLPYYGVALERHIMPGTGDPNDENEETRIGRLTNPTVHIGLNQLRRVVNRLIARYKKPPEQIVIELARDLKLDEERKGEIRARNRDNRKAAEKRSEKLRDIGQRDTGRNRVLLKLWEELNPDNPLDRRCVYTGQRISIGMLFSDEGLVDIDHILPFGVTLDDSDANRLLCTSEANKLKRKRSPSEAFGPGSGNTRYPWDEIVERANRLPDEKRWRFGPEAMKRFDKNGGFLARQLVDTQYLSRLAREYLVTLYPEKGEGSGRVWVSPGRLTEMLRRSWGLNSILPDHNLAGGADQPKNRRDHRHHPIDAAVIAVTDRSLLNRISYEAGARGHEAAHRMTADLPEPWDGFSDELRRVVSTIVVSHRPDHGTVVKKPGAPDATAGRLHNDTAYGFTGEKDARGNDIVVHRAPLSTLTKAEDIEQVRDPDLRAALRDFTMGLGDGLSEKEKATAFQERIARFPQLGPPHYRGLRRVRVVEPLSLIPIRDGNGRIYKGYKGDSNYRYDVWELKDGKWVAEVISMFDAHQRDFASAVRRDNPTARKVLSLHQNDMLAIEPDGQGRKLVRIVKFGKSGQIVMAEPHEAGDLKKRDSTPNEIDPFKYIHLSAGGLKRVKARQVRIDELGRVLDPGPRGRSPDAG